MDWMQWPEDEEPRPRQGKRRADERHGLRQRPDQDDARQPEAGPAGDDRVFVRTVGGSQYGQPHDGIYRPQRVIGWDGDPPPRGVRPAAGPRAPLSATVPDGSGTPVRQARSVWGAPVIGAPTACFEPRPPVSISYRPDSVVDGWETDDFVVRAASVRGYIHRYRGTPRQDDVAVAHHRPSGAVVFAVADGVSSARHSHIGASAACRAAVTGILSDLDAGTGAVDWQNVVERTAWQLIEQARAVVRADADAELAEQELATTLVTGLVRPAAAGPEVSMIQIGDSSAWVLRNGRYHCVLDVKYSADDEVVSSAVTALPRVPRVTPRAGTLASNEVLLVGTDGFGDPLGDGTGEVGGHFADRLIRPTSPFTFASDLDFSRETFDDDRTLLALWTRSDAPQGRR